MSITVKFRRGNTSTSNTLTLANGELYIDTSKRTVVVHDGSTLGGNPLATEQNLISGLATKPDYETVNTSIQTAITNLIGAAPSALDTLNELASALGNNPNYATTVTTALGTKQSTLVSGTNIKTINGSSILGSGDLPIVQFGLLTETNINAGIRDIVSNTALTPNGAVATLVTSPKKFSDENGSIYVTAAGSTPQAFTISNTTLPSTYEFWYYPTTTGRTEYIFSSIGTGNNSISYDRNGGLYDTDVTGSFGSVLSGSSNLLQVNTWNHVAIYLSSTQTRVWFNGVAVMPLQTFYVNGSDDYRQSSTRTGIRLGGHYDGWQKPEGYYGQVRISNGDLYGVANDAISVPTTSFTTSGASYLIKYVTANKHVDVNQIAQLNAGVVNVSSINGDGSGLTNVNAPPTIWTWNADWQQSVSGSNYYPTGAEQASTFSKVLTASKAGSIEFTYYPNDVYFFQQVGTAVFKFSVTVGTTEYTIDHILSNTHVGSNDIGPFRIIVPVSLGSTITLRMKWMLQSPASGGDYFNYSGNGTHGRMFAQYVNTISSNII